LIRVYFDSSAIFKLSHQERETLPLIQFLEETPLEASTSVMADVEVVRNLRNRQLNDDGALGGFYLVALDDDIRRTAATLESRTLRALDAIHIASALAIGDRDLQFVTYDDRQAEAARAAGLKVVQPGRN
jgi:predicted nucleic acid-binding protein